MEIRNLITFLQVAERKSFTGAAEALNYTQSTVSAQIKQLEDELGTQLFDRINHRVMLTHSGKSLIKYAQNILNTVEQMQNYDPDKEDLRQTVRFAMAPSICNLMMGKTFRIFSQMYPDIKVKIIEAETYEMLDLLNRNEADIIFAVDRHIYSTDYTVTCEKKVKMNFVAPKEFSLAKEKSLSIHDIAKYPFVLTEKGMSYRKTFDEKFASEYLEINPIVEMGNTSLILELVELGIGVSFLPEYVTRKSFNEGKVTYLNVDNFEQDMWCQLLHHKDKWISPAIRKILDYCEKSMVLI